MNLSIKRSLWRLSAIILVAPILLLLSSMLVLPLTMHASAATTNVSIVDFAFQPSTINVQLGDTVIWTNNGAAPHTVTSDGGSGPLASPTLNNGGTYQFTFTIDGTYDYHCTFHSATMKGTVVVGTVIPEYSGFAFVTIGLLAVLIVLASVGRKGRSSG